MIESTEYADAESESNNESVEYIESGYGESGYGEARRPAPVRTAPRQSAYTPRPSGTSSPVTQAQLQAALARVGQQIGTNSNAIKTVDGRVRGVVTEQGRIGASFRKEAAERKKESESLRRELQSTKELSALIPLIAKPDTTLGKLAPLAHLLPSDIWGGGASAANGSTGAPSASSSLLGGSGIVALIAIAAASGVIK